MGAPDQAWLEHRIVDGSPDAILYADREGVIRYWNGSAARVFGFSGDEALGRSLDIIIPERFRGRHWAGWVKVLETGVTRYGAETLAVPAIRSDGGTISVEFSIQALRGDDGAIRGFAAILRDVTERFLREKGLRKELAELRTSCGKE